MSVVSSVIITCSLGEEENQDQFPAVDFINAWLNENHKGTLTYLSPQAGGHKAMQIEVFGGAFNYLNIDEFAKVLLQAPWRQRESVTIFIAGENDEAMREVRLVNDGVVYAVEHEELRKALAVSVMCT